VGTFPVADIITIAMKRNAALKRIKFFRRPDIDENLVLQAEVLPK
jgi:hypothetical protein